MHTEHPRDQPLGTGTIAGTRAATNEPKSTHHSMWWCGVGRSMRWTMCVEDSRLKAAVTLHGTRGPRARAGPLVPAANEASVRENHRPVSRKRDHLSSTECASAKRGEVLLARQLSVGGRAFYGRTDSPDARDHCRTHRRHLWRSW